MVSATDEALASLVDFRGLRINGMSVSPDIGDAITTANTVRTIVGAPTLELDIDDQQRTLLRSGVLSHRATVALHPFTYEIVAVSKSGGGLSITCEDQTVAELRQHKERYKVKPGVMTHVEFARKLVSEVKWIKFVTDPAAHAVRSNNALVRGDTSNKHKKESTWDCLTRLAGERGWRVFVRGVNEVWYMPDSSLIDKATDVFRIAEGEGGVDTIDFDFDEGKRIAQMTANVRASQWRIPPGGIVLVDNLGPANGRWIVQDITKPATSLQTTLTLIKPMPVLPEPKKEKSTAAGGKKAEKDSSSGDPWNFNETGLGLGGSLAPRRNNNKFNLDFVDEALSQIGKKYVYGSGPSPTERDPTSFDCSGLVHWAAGRVGVDLPRTSSEQWAFCQKHHTQVMPDEALSTRGALLFEQSATHHHVAISLGDGEHTIEAMGAAYGVNKQSVTGRGWTGMALIPGMHYGAAPEGGGPIGKTIR